MSTLQELQQRWCARRQKNGVTGFNNRDTGECEFAVISGDRNYKRRSNQPGFTVLDGAVNFTQLIRRMKIMGAGMYHAAVLHNGKQQQADQADAALVDETQIHV